MKQTYLNKSGVLVVSSMAFSLFSSSLTLAETSAMTQAAPSVPSLEDQLKGLSGPENQAPAGLPYGTSDEKVYSVQTRYSPLRFTSEIGIGGGRNMSGDSFLVTQELTAAYRFHFSDRWNVALSGAYVYNELNGTGQRVFKEEQRIPDLTYAKTRGDIALGFNTFYGKFRLSMDKVFYFDQYLQLGAGIVNLPTTTSNAFTADAGFVFWLGKRGSFRVGLKDWYYHEKRIRSEGSNHNLIAHLDIGILLGGER